MSKKDDISIFDSHYYKKYKNSVKIIGLWPYENIWMKWSVRVFVIIVLISLVILQVSIIFFYKVIIPS